MAHTSLTEQQQKILLQVAEDSLAYGLVHGKPLPVNPNDYDGALQEIRATFVTLEINKHLRGCIGMLEAVQPLIVDVAHNAYSAGFRDYRFPPLTAAEFPRVDIHISILTPAQAMSFSSEQDLIQQLRPNVDGLIMQDGTKRGTFLPSVWESLPHPHDFLQHLKLKSGLPKNYWSETMQIFRYTCDSIP